MNNQLKLAFDLEQVTLENGKIDVQKLLNTIKPEYHVCVTENGESYNSRIIKVTPEIAKLFLEVNTMNRRFSKKNIKEMVRDMKKDTYYFTSAPIIFSYEDVLLDGQNRLSAVIESGLAQEFVVNYGLDPKIMSVLDTGKKRTASDVFDINKLPNATLAAAATKNIMNFNRGSIGETSGHSVYFSNEDILKFYNEKKSFLEPLITISTSLYKRGGNSKILSPSVLATCLITLTKKFEKDVYKRCNLENKSPIDFMEKLVLGTNLELGNPILVLRENLRSLKENGTSYHFKKLYLLIFAIWDLYIHDKKKLDHIKVTSKNIDLDDNYMPIIHEI